MQSCRHSGDDHGTCSQPNGLRQRKYRYTARALSGFYNGYYHAFLIFAGLYEIYFATRHISNVLGNFCASGAFIGQWVEYLFHRFYNIGLEIPCSGCARLCAPTPDASLALRRRVPRSPVATCVTIFSANSPCFSR